MLTPTKYIWMNGKFVPWNKAQIHVLSHSLHYGAAVFEGVRVYETEEGPAIFRLQDHIKRLFYSASTVRMKPKFSQRQLEKACVELVKKNKLQVGYVRPLMFYGYGKMGLRPIGAPTEVMVACWPWGKYLDNLVEVKISKFMRIHPDTTVANAKISGHYVNSQMASFDAIDSGYDEAIFLDHHGDVAEGPGENVFMVKNKVIYTPELGDIIKGITRTALMTIAKDLGYKVVEKTIKPAFLKSADEAFFTGTAAEVTPISRIDRKKLGDGKVGPITKELKKAFLDAVHGRLPKYKKWLTVVK
jgi:branched-chain amino acid aminotransferase